jgi:hypothetical protein
MTKFVSSFTVSLSFGTVLPNEKLVPNRAELLNMLKKVKLGEQFINIFTTHL